VCRVCVRTRTLPLSLPPLSCVSVRSCVPVCLIVRVRACVRERDGNREREVVAVAARRRAQPPAR
jgi:hypothetical protein